MLDRLSKSKEAAEAFAALALSGNKALLLSTLVWRRIASTLASMTRRSRGSAASPIIRRRRRSRRNWNRALKILAHGPRTLSRLRRIRTTLALHNDIREFNLRSISRKADKVSARSRAIGRL